MFILTLFKSTTSLMYPVSVMRGTQNGRAIIEYLTKDTVMFSEVKIYNFSQELNKHIKIDNGYKVIMKTYESGTETVDSLVYESALINTSVGPEGTGNFFFTAPSSAYFTMKYFVEVITNSDDVSSKEIPSTLSLDIRHYVGAAGDNKIVSYPQTVIHYLEKEISEAISKCEDLLRLFKSNGLKDLELDDTIERLKFIIYATILVKIVVIVISFYLSNKSTNSFFMQVLQKK
ncbi:hypothetical protein CDIK_0228 [Cucumispora dikerogammari]|nr:hypothetical protein CDIK_0228 [Cucumispora dikerogammari]